MKADVCIVGAGAAGITLALELKRTSAQVVLLESGSLDFDPRAQALGAGRYVGVPLDEMISARVRRFGGTTWAWGGWCRPFDAIDFERRPWIPDSGWPISREDLEPFFPRALEILNVEPRGYEPQQWTKPGGLLEDERFENIVFLVSRGPARFGELYRAELEQAENVRTFLRSTVVRLVQTDEAITSAQVRTLDGTTFDVRARIFVLACGAVQNARLLLVSNAGNQHDQVGRWFMQHPDVRAATLLAAGASGMELLGRGAERTDVGVATRVRAETQRRHEIGNAHFLLVDGRRPSRREKLKALLRSFTEPEPVHLSLQKVLPDLLANGANEEVRIVTIAERPEQVPNRDSRVLLDTEQDPLGVPLPKIDWRLSELDRRTFDVTQRLLAQTVGAQSIGRLHTRTTDPREPPAEGGSTAGSITWEPRG